MLFAISNSGIFDSNASDQELINKTKELPEVQAFLAKYPNVTVWVQKVDDIDVSYGGGDAARNGGSLTISVFMGRSSLNVHQVMLVCYSSVATTSSNSTHVVEDPRFFQVNDSEIISYLEEGKEEKCFG